MAESIVSDIVLKLLDHLGRLAVQEITPYFSRRDELKELERTMQMIQARLLDAERRGEGENEAAVKSWLKSLKGVLYRMGDLFEEVAMADEEHKQYPGGKLSKCMCILFLRSSPLRVNKKVAQEAKAIMQELKSITSVMDSLKLREHSIEEQCVVNLSSRGETYSFILEKEVIGREEDKDEIVRMLLASDNVRENMSVIPIVGIGGLGKTTLAQLAFNDENVQKHFELKGWACISEFRGLEELVGKVLRSITGDDYRQYSMEQLQSRLREAVNNKIYLLVLDDMWDEDRERWLVLKRLLCGGKRGSKIIITSRSGVVAQNMGTVNPYQLGGLQEDKSWALFKSLAFREGQEERNASLIGIGRDIVKKCANVPLAIRTIAALLYSKDTEQEWEYFKESELRMIEHSESSIMSSLKLSYNHLPSHLKQCFAYCSLFPKDYIYEKQDLIYLWMAQEFIRPSNGNRRSLEDVGHGYFMELLRRSFFQEVERDEIGDIIHCKMHDLMHDLAQNVAGDECLLVNRPTQHIKKDNTIWHMSFTVGSSWEAPSWLLNATQLRSLLLQPRESCSSTTMLHFIDVFSSLRFLRALSLAGVNSESLPNSIGELKHLRYLRLGFSTTSFCLPEWITRLKNLQTLDLRECLGPRALPKGFNKLTNLRHLLLNKRYPVLIDMPPEFGKLTSLHVLDVFVVGKSIGLHALADLNALAGKLVIRFEERHGQAVSEAKAANLKGKKLTGLELRWLSSYRDAAAVSDLEEDELVLRSLQPPITLRRLKVMDWKGRSFPSWGMDSFPCLLPNLVSIEIVDCSRCECLPPFGQLPCLVFLCLWDLKALEYIEIGGDTSLSSSAAPYFTSLERLQLQGLTELKGWSREKDDIDQLRQYENQYLLQQPIFPRLSELTILECPKLMSMPLVPRLESLHVNEIHEQLLTHLLCADEPEATTSSYSSSTPSKLKKLFISSVQELDSFSINLFSLEYLTIYPCRHLVNLSAEFPTSLRRLQILQCGRLKDISGALQHLSVLEVLDIWGCQELDLWDDDEGTSISSSSSSVSDTLAAWQGLKSLQSLKLTSISKLESLPRGLACLTTLQELKIDRLRNLEALPEWIGNLTQLRRLEIEDCPKLKRRCQRPYGEDWPLIQHIPHVYLR